tara:strand:+ start:638 stop:1165 length:528 start_codon:yes stop_codon:yes gene_type:complete
MWLPPTLKTNRLTLRGLKLEDAEAIFLYAKNPNVALYTMWDAHRSVKDTQDFIQHYVFSKYQNQEPEPFAIIDESNQLIGTVGCFKVKNHAMELAYALAESEWGKGYIAEAAKEVLDFCFKEYGVERIQCRCKAENVQSERVMQKIGMTYEGTLRRDVFHRDKFWDMKYYSILKK